MLISTCNKRELFATKIVFRCYESNFCCYNNCFYLLQKELFLPATKKLFLLATFFFFLLATKVIFAAIKFISPASKTATDLLSECDLCLLLQYSYKNYFNANNEIFTLSGREHRLNFKGFLLFLFNLILIPPPLHISQKSVFPHLTSSKPCLKSFKHNF